MDEQLIEKVSVTAVKDLLENLRQKFQTKTLTVDDFNVAFINENQIRNRISQSDEDDDVEFELDFENGQIKLTSPKISPKRHPSNEEIEFRSQMNTLMTTFENETKKLDKKIDRERGIIEKRCRERLESDFMNKEEDFMRAIKDLEQRIEIMEKEHEELLFYHEQEKRDIEQFYLNQIDEERRKLKKDAQKKIIQAKSKEWQKTAI